MIAQLVLQGDTKSVEGLKETSNALQEHWSFLMHHDTITGTSTQFVTDHQSELISHVFD